MFFQKYLAQAALWFTQTHLAHNIVRNLYKFVCSCVLICAQWCAQVRKLRLFQSQRNYAQNCTQTFSVHVIDVKRLDGTAFLMDLETCDARRLHLRSVIHFPKISANYHDSWLVEALKSSKDLWLDVSTLNDHAQLCPGRSSLAHMPELRTQLLIRSHAFWKVLKKIDYGLVASSLFLRWLGWRGYVNI